MCTGKQHFFINGVALHLFPNLQTAGLICILPHLLLFPFCVLQTPAGSLTTAATDFQHSHVFSICCLLRSHNFSEPKFPSAQFFPTSFQRDSTAVPPLGSIFSCLVSIQYLSFHHYHHGFLARNTYNQQFTCIVVSVSCRTLILHSCISLPGTSFLPPQFPSPTPYFLALCCLVHISFLLPILKVCFIYSSISFLLSSLHRHPLPFLNTFHLYTFICSALFVTISFPRL